MKILELDPHTIWMIAIAYVLIALVIAVLSYNRRVDGIALFFFGLLLTPAFSLFMLLRSQRKPKWNPSVGGTECAKCGYTYFDPRSHCTVCGTELKES